MYWCSLFDHKFLWVFSICFIHHELLFQLDMYLFQSPIYHFQKGDKNKHLILHWRRSLGDWNSHVEMIIQMFNVQDFQIFLA